MCGICGFTYRDDSLINRMNESIRHRGPDDDGTYVSDDISLGHRRLAILDLSDAGHQPMISEDGNLVIIHNGEIYNFMEVRKELESKGHSFRSHSDTEVILSAYQEWGKDCLDRFRGMFAFAIWDERKRELFLARDRLGVKPLYYMEKDGKLFFASEVKAFRETGELDDLLDPSALNLYFTFRFTPGPQTVLKDVKKLEPGHFMVWKKGCLEIQKYWDIDLEEISEESAHQSYSTDRYVEEFLDIFRESVRLRLVSDLPVGAYLSGGLDSSFIVGMMAGIADSQVSTFSVGFPGGADESGYARIVADRFETDHHLLEVKSNAVDVIPDVAWHLDEPLSDAATIPTYLMSEITKKDVTVILSGEGSDEQLAGYDKYKPLYYPHLFRQLAPKGLLRSMSGLASNYPKAYRAMEYMGNLNDMPTAYMRFFSVFLPEERARLFLDAEVRKEVSRGKDLSIAGRYLKGKGDIINELLLLDLKTWLPDDLLLKNDKMTMAHAVEARTPFLDHKLVEFLMKVPGSLKLRFFKEKYLLRKGMTGVVPDSILKRKKQGFSVPIQSWIKDELKDLTEDLFSKENIESVGLIDYPYVKDFMRKDLANPYPLRQFWTVFSFLAWQRYFLNR